MEAHARAPDPLTKDGDMASNWQSWKEDFIIFMKVTGYIHKPNDVRANLLKNRIGKVGIDAIQSMSFDNPKDRDDMDVLIVKLEEFFNPPKNEVVERYNFFTRVMKYNESIEEYILILKEKAKTCNFNDMTDSIIRDKIILNTYDKILRKKFFEADNLDLQKLVAIYNDYSTNTEKMKQVTQENRTEGLPKSQVNCAKKGCWRCGRPHPPKKCPAWGSKCTKCEGINHFTHCCQGSKPGQRTNNNVNVNKNLLDSMQQMKFPSKTSLPDIPKASSDVANSSFNNGIASDFVTLDAHNATSSSHYNNTMSQSTSYLPSSSQYNYSYVKGANAEMVTNLYDRHEKIQSKASAGTSQPSNNFKQRQTKSFKNKYDQKKSDGDCVLS